MISTNNNLGLHCLCYGWRLTNSPSTCSCGSKIGIKHAMGCKKGEVITVRHNDFRDLTENLLTDVCKVVDIKPQHLPVTREIFINRAANTSNEARFDIQSRRFWVRGQQILLDVKVTDPNTNRYLTKALSQ